MAALQSMYTVIQPTTKPSTVQGPHEVAGQAFLALPSKQIKISKNGIKISLKDKLFSLKSY